MPEIMEALKIVMENVRPLGIERIPIAQSYMRTLAEPITALYPVPPFDNSAMDGFAVRYEDTRDARPDNPVTVTVIDTIAAGHVSEKTIRQREAIRIMTGAPIPAGADAIVKVEDTSAGSEPARVNILKGPAMLQHIRFKGDDITGGSCILSPGVVLTPARMGLLASLGVSAVSVYLQPRVAILSTGDELVEVGHPLETGKIYPSNSFTLMGLVRSCGAIPVYLGIARDNNADLLAKLTLAVQMDVIVTTGGVSVGDFDLVKEALRQAGTDMKFWRVRMKPGRPQAFGTIGGKPTFGLPGNPVSTMVSFEMFVRPALRKMMGHLTYDNPYIRAVAGENIHSSKGRVNLLRARLERREDELLAFVTGRQTSGILTSMAAAHGLILVPADIALIEKGSTVTVLVLDWEFMNSPWPL